PSRSGGSQAASPTRDRCKPMLARRACKIMYIRAKALSSASTPMRRRQHAWTMIEMMVTMVIGTAVLAAVGVTCSFANRTLDAIGNYADLDRQSSNALNLMARDVRQTGGLTNFNSA